LIFQVVMSSGSVVEVGVGIFLNFSTGSGTIAGPDVNVVNGISATGATLRTFSFDTDGNTSPDSLSGTSDQFWVTFANVSDGTTVSFMVDDGSAGLVTVLGTVNLPEPNALTLLGLGLLTLAGTRFLRG
jgi:hypothetical protein